MGKHRKEGGPTPKAILRKTLLNTFRPNASRAGRGLPVRHRVAAAVVAAGAVATVSQPLATGANSPAAQQPHQEAEQENLGAALTGTADSAPSVQLLGAATDKNSHAEARKLDKSQEIERKRAEIEEALRQAREEAQRAAEKAAAERAEAERRTADEAANARAGLVNSEGYVKPADATFTSGFGSRWGSSHNGIDLANDIGTPIYSTAAGEVISAGPASGFGQWVRVQHDDGTITVYGHINTIDVSVGERVEAGEQIATMGNEGQSTGPHLHFEVIENGAKINPLIWLEEVGISVQ